MRIITNGTEIKRVEIEHCSVEITRLVLENATSFYDSMVIFDEHIIMSTAEKSELISLQIHIGDSTILNADMFDNIKTVKHLLLSCTDDTREFCTNNTLEPWLEFIEKRGKQLKALKIRGLKDENSVDILKVPKWLPTWLPTYLPNVRIMELHVAIPDEVNRDEDLSAFQSKIANSQIRLIILEATANIERLKCGKWSTEPYPCQGEFLNADEKNDLAKTRLVCKNPMTPRDNATGQEDTTSQAIEGVDSICNNGDDDSGSPANTNESKQKRGRINRLWARTVKCISRQKRSSK